MGSERRPLGWYATLGQAPVRYNPIASGAVRVARSSRVERHPKGWICGFESRRIILPGPKTGLPNGRRDDPVCVPGSFQEEVDMPVPAKAVRFEVNDRGCHICVSHCTLKGYPVRYEQKGGARRCIWLHREAYEKAHGKIPNRLVVRHKCDTPLCINPDHLIVGTHADNMRDRDERGRGVRGERSPFAILTREKVVEIRETTGPLKAAAEKYGVSISLISKVRKRIAWKSVP